jgi:hypothetical protein
MQTTFRTTYTGPSENRGPRIRVTNLRTGKSRWHYWDYSINAGPDQHEHAVRGSLVDPSQIQLTGEDAKAYYFTVTREG